MTVRAKIKPRRFISKLKDPLDAKTSVRIKPAKARTSVRRFRARAAILLSTDIALCFLNSNVSL